MKSSIEPAAATVVRTRTINYNYNFIGWKYTKKCTKVRPIASDLNDFGTAGKFSTVYIDGRQHLHTNKYKKEK